MKKRIGIVGSGSAGCAAAIYCVRNGYETDMYTGLQPGGQLTITTDVENYPGFDLIQGPELMERMRKHCESAGVNIIEDSVVCVDEGSDCINLRTNSDELQYDAVIVATGARARWLELESEAQFKNYGISACATCDGFFFKNKKVAVIGGGNTAVEEALHLAGLASEVILVHRRDELRAEEILQKKLFDNGKINVIWDHTVDEFLGYEAPIKKLTGIRLKSTKNDSMRQVDLDGAFIAIGHVPESKVFAHLVETDDAGYIKTTPGSTHTKRPRIFAAGDVSDLRYRQAITAAGFGCMAALDLRESIQKGLI